MFEFGNYRVQPTQDFGNIYESEGIVLQVAQLTDEEWECNYFFDNAVEEMEEKFSEALRGKFPPEEKGPRRWVERKMELFMRGYAAGLDGR